MPATILIAGQGLAGTLLAWEFAREGIDFVIADEGHESASSRIGAGIINPITGQRLVKSWQVETLLPAALATYREMEATWGVRFLQPMRVRRFFADDRERRIFDVKFAQGELAPYATPRDDDGFWIEGAARVDTGALITAARAWLRASGRLLEQRIDLVDARRRHDLTILCSGASHTGMDMFSEVKLRPAKGEILTLAVDELTPDVILNSGHWILPVGNGQAWVGATVEPGVDDRTPTQKARALLEHSARTLLKRPFTVVDHTVGIRMTTSDRHPVLGRSQHDPHVGIFNGLGSKGALLAPRLARQWVNHLTEGVPVDSDVCVSRFRT